MYLRHDPHANSYFYIIKEDSFLKIKDTLLSAFEEHTKRNNTALDIRQILLYDLKLEEGKEFKTVSVKQMLEKNLKVKVEENGIERLADRGLSRIQHWIKIRKTKKELVDVNKLPILSFLFVPEDSYVPVSLYALPEDKFELFKLDEVRIVPFSIY